MNENARKWVEALRSGKYKQAKGALRRDDGFCCLGVACDLYAKERGVEWDLQAGRLVFKGERGELPRAVREWLGLKRKNGSRGGGAHGESLTRLNDGGVSFARIANIIESDPRELFR